MRHMNAGEEQSALLQMQCIMIDSRRVYKQEINSAFYRDAAPSIVRSTIDSSLSESSGCALTFFGLGVGSEHCRVSAFLLSTPLSGSWTLGVGRVTGITLAIRLSLSTNGTGILPSRTRLSASSRART
ncbi:rh63 [macacine betaherpesvirus 3]|uniref:Rh63 n=1 Tax=Rhesus cytomegalovirus (strain 68-1) TaxID=47929 RepID=Q7TFR8_RHCM6|nr:rh63 [macacine betaherpesvirus 3]AAP50590.1 rh63 [macacine betaherpesvirus 3]AAZ80561.1 rh63 [macacine betaherpesvirus 3]